jgi:hypothetical protein
MERNDITIFSNGNSVKNWDSDAWFDCGLLMLACVYWLVQFFMIKASRVEGMGVNIWPSM